ncbi:MAG: hypothetical protein DMF93_04430 [Acidobacteria bacterium]|nr:MAG: hypothetical protein DMF93_04430 [Acidobacteriota bacterium]
MPAWSVIVGRRPLSLVVDGLIIAALFAGTAVWGFRYWTRVSVNGQPFYYQLYFEPAVMVACGKGFVVARPQVPEMVAFLQQRVDRFSCDAITPQTALGTEEVFQQGPWLYLMLTVGWAWRLLGVSWSALGPLFAAMFGTTIAAAYLIFRLGVGPLLAAIGAAGLSTSRIHLKFLPILRDYAKAPTIAALYGATLGIGYGFRTDFLAYIPSFFVTLALFAPGGLLRNLQIKAAAAAVCVAAFLLAAWPAISTLAASKPGCQWHVVILGFARQFDRPLGVESAPYEVGREYLDEWAYTTVTSYAARAHPGIGHIEYCEVAYGGATRAYLLDVAKRFPADLIVRAYGSVLRIVELPFLPVEGWYADDRPLDWNAGHGSGLVIVLAAALVAAAIDRRIGLFVIFVLIYFGGLPAIQFSERHFFHFEFITWFAALFLVQTAMTDAPALRALGARRIAAGRRLGEEIEAPDPADRAERDIHGAGPRASGPRLRPIPKPPTSSSSTSTRLRAASTRPSRFGTTSHAVRMGASFR